MSATSWSVLGKLRAWDSTARRQWFAASVTLMPAASSPRAEPPAPQKMSVPVSPEAAVVATSGLTSSCLSDIDLRLLLDLADLVIGQRVVHPAGEHVGLHGEGPFVDPDHHAA